MESLAEITESSTSRVMVLDGPWMNHLLLHVTEGSQEPGIPAGRAR